MSRSSLLSTRVPLITNLSQCLPALPLDIPILVPRSLCRLMSHFSHWRKYRPLKMNDCCRRWTLIIYRVASAARVWKLNTGSPAHERWEASHAWCGLWVCVSVCSKMVDKSTVPFTILHIVKLPVLQLIGELVWSKIKQGSVLYQLIMDTRVISAHSESSSGWYCVA